jgi:hypothetical protein
LVLIVPSLIGVPVAFSPGLGPHDDVLTAVPLEPELVTAAVEVALLLELLLPQPARRSPPPVRRSAGVVKRARACSPSSPRVDSPGAVTADADSWSERRRKGRLYAAPVDMSNDLYEPLIAGLQRCERAYGSVRHIFSIDQMLRLSVPNLIFSAVAVETLREGDSRGEAHIINRFAGHSFSWRAQRAFGARSP